LIDQWEFQYGLPRTIFALLALALVPTVLALGLPVFSVLAWRHRYWSIGRRLLYTLNALAALQSLPHLARRLSRHHEANAEFHLQLFRFD
jgi:hypothetical protein